MNEFFEAIQLLFSDNGELRQIVGITLQMSFLSTIISGTLGISLGIILGSHDFKARKLIMRIVNTLMGLPPVVAGLLVFMMLSRKGPLGELGLLFSVSAMVIAQVLLIAPVICGLTASIVSARAPMIFETTRGLNMSRIKEFFLLIYECRVQLVSVLLTGFGRSIAEVGAVQLVGGNIQFKTRVMTTAIVLETNKGNFEFAIALGFILLIIAFVINSLAQRLQEGE